MKTNRLLIILLALAVTALAVVATAEAKYRLTLGDGSHSPLIQMKVSGGTDVRVTSTGLAANTSYDATCEFIKGQHQAIVTALGPFLSDSLGAVSFTTPILPLLGNRQPRGTLECLYRPAGSPVFQIASKMTDGQYADIVGLLTGN